MKTPEEMLALRKKRREELSAAELDELTKNLSVQERLERKFETDVIEVVMKDDLDNFTLRFRKLSPIVQDELAKLVSLSSDLAKMTPEEKSAVDDKLYGIVADASLDNIPVDFWKSKTGYSTGDFVTIITKLTSASSLPDQKYMEEIQKFRM